jgi:hypothetical protein
MKYLPLIMVLFSGCASLSEYNRGCQAGLNEQSRAALDYRDVDLNTISNNSKAIQKFCDELESHDRAVRDHERTFGGRR